MAKDSSFDIVSDYDIAKLTNALEQTQRDIAARYDFKGTNAKAEFEDGTKKTLMIYGDNDFHIASIEDILRKRLAGAGISPLVLDTSAEPMQHNMIIRKRLTLVKGLDQEKAKQITKMIRDTYPKVKTQIQGEEVRVTSPKKDELQSVMNLLRSADLPFPVDFTNYR